MQEPTRKELLNELAELRLRLEEAEDTLSAIRHGDIDALVVSGPEGDRVFTLKGADHSYRVLVETINEGAATLSPDGKILYANRRLADLLQTPLERVIGSFIHDYVVPQDRQWFEALLQLRQEDNRGEVRLRAAQGKEVPTFLSLSRLPLEDSANKVCLVATDLTEQKRQEEILAAGRLSRAILDQAEQAIVVLDDKGVITQASQAAQRLYGGNLLLENFEDAFPLNFQAGAEANFPEEGFPLTGILQGVIYQGVEAFFQRQDGQEFHVLLNAGPLTADSGAVLGGIVSLTDITARKQSEEELRAAHEQITALVDESPLAIIVLDREARIRQWNPAAERLFGWRAEKILGKPYPLVPEDEWEEFFHYFQRELEGHRYTSLEQRRQRQDGKIVDISLSSSPLHNAAGEVVGVMGILEDITARKQTEEARRTQAQVLESMAEGVSVTDRRGYILYTNPAFDEMFGYEIGELVGRHSNTLNNYPPEENLRVVQKIVRQVNTTGVWSGEFHNRKKDGHPFFTSGRVSALEVGGKKLFISVQEDITERKHREEMLRRQAELLDLAHDAILVRDMAGRITYWNRGAEELYGWPRREAMGKVAHQLLASAYPEPLVDIETQVIEQGRWEGEVVQTARDGRRLIMESRWSLKRDEEGRPLAILMINHDVTARRQAEEALRKSERRFQRLVEANIMGVAVSDEETIVEANDAFLRMLGYSREELQTGEINWVELTPTEFFAQDARALHELRTTGVHSPFEKAFLRRDGSQVAVMVGGALLEEEPLSWVSFILDISERKKLEEALRQSEARFRAIFANASIGIATTDLKGHFQQFNAPVAKGLGYTPTELRNMTFFQVTHPEDLEKDAALFTELAAGKRERYQVEKRYITKDGRVLFGRLHVSLARNQAGEPEFAVSLVEDITARKEAQAALAESEARYRSLVDMSPDAIVVHAKGRVIFANPAGLELFGAANPQEILGQHILDLVHPDYREIVKQRVKRGYAGEPADLREIKIWRFNGRVLDVETAATPITFQGQPAVQVVVRDITARKQAEAELARQKYLLQGIIDNIPVMLAIYDPQVKTFRFNSELRRVLGWAEADMAVDDPMELFYPDPQYREEVRGYMQSLEPGWRDFQVTAKGGGVVDSTWANIRLPDDTRIGIGVDIRERKHMEEALRRSEKRARRQLDEIELIYRSAPVGLGFFDLDCRYLRVNERLAEINGVAVSEHLGRTPREVLPDVGPHIEELFTRIIETGEPCLDLEISGITPAQPGVVRTWMAQYIPQKDEAGRVIGISAVVEEITERKRAEEALRERTERYELVVAGAHAAIWDWDVLNHHVFYSPQWKTLHGYTEDDAIDRLENWSECLHPEDAPRVLAALEEHLEGRTPVFAEEYRIISKDGVTKWVFDRGLAQRDPEGRVIRMAGSATDITQRKMFEKEMERGHRLLEALMEYIPEGVTIADAPDVNIRMVSKYGQQLVGKPPEVLQTPVGEHSQKWGLFHADGVTPTRDEELPLTRATQKGEIVRNEEYVVHREDGVKIPLLCNAGPILDKEGEILGGIIAWRDITERKRAEEALRQSEARYRAIGELIPFGIWTAGPDGGIEYLSSSFLKMAGKTLEECQEFGWLHLLPYEDIQPTLKAWQQCLETGSFWDYEYKIRGKDGYYRTILSRGLPLADNQGRITSWLGINLDITGRKEMEEELRRAHDTLEKRVAERTAALRLANENLLEEMQHRAEAEHLLRESEARFTAFMQYLPAAAVMRDIQGRYIFANETWENLTGKKREEWLGKTVADIWPLEQAKRFKNLDFEILSSGQPAEDLEELEWPDGRHYYLTHRFPIPDEHGLPYMVGTIAVDITARRQAEVEVKRQAAIVAGMNRILREALASETEEELGRTCLAVAEELSGSRFGFINFVNEEGNVDFVAISEVGWEACSMADVTDLAHLKNVQPGGLVAGTVRKGAALMTNDPASHPDTAGTPEGHPHLTAYLGVPLAYGEQIIGVIGLGNKAGGYTDTDLQTMEILAPSMVEALTHHQAEKDLKRSESKLRFLADQLLTAQENERKRLASELHDELGHALLTLKLALSSIARELLPDQEDLQQEIKDQLEYINEVIGEVRRLYHDLSPGNVEDLGLTKALRTLIKDFADLQDHIDWEVDLADLDGLFSLPVQTIIYRLVQEALTNIGKHANPKHVTVAAAPGDDQVHFVIEDDGAGFDMSVVLDSEAGLGLVAMEERLNMVGGTFEVWSNKGAGTRVSFVIPAHPEEEGA